RNVGSRETEYRPTVESLPATWYRLAQPVRVGAGATAVTELWLTPPRTAEAGSQRFQLRFEAADFPDAAEDVEVELRLVATASGSEPASNGPTTGGGTTPS